MSRRPPLPTFERPPIIEAVLGLQFQRLPNFSNAQLGAFWTTLRSDWPHVNDAPPIDEVLERFEEKEAWSPEGLRMKLTSEVGTRLQIRNPSKDRMLQIQNGRLHFNWTRVQDEAPYPGYESIRPEFDLLLARFQRFVEENGLGVLQPNQWEIIYVNHIQKGTVWNTAEDCETLFHSLLRIPSLTSIGLEDLRGFWRFEIQPKRGRLYIDLVRAIQSSNREVLKLTLTARGPVAHQSKQALDDGLSLGHETIVSTFRDITSEHAHQFWGLKHEPSTR